MWQNSFVESDIVTKGCNVLCTWLTCIASFADKRSGRFKTHVNFTWPERKRSFYRSLFYCVGEAPCQIGSSCERCGDIRSVCLWVRSRLVLSKAKQIHHVFDLSVPAASGIRWIIAKLQCTVAGLSIFSIEGSCMAEWYTLDCQPLVPERVFNTFYILRLVNLIVQQICSISLALRLRVNANCSIKNKIR